MKRRRFLAHAVNTLLLSCAPGEVMSRTANRDTVQPAAVTLFLCGDVMTGRGIDQVLPHPGDPVLYESYVRNAGRYVELAEARNGPVPAPVDFAWPWGDALEVLQRTAPDVRIINLETSVTRSADYWPDKGIHYRMHPDNVPCLNAAHIDCCVLANNHVLDWGYAGLEETLTTLHDAHLKTAGAGRDRAAAAAPAILPVNGAGRVVVFSYGLASSGIDARWAAAPDRAGVNLLPDLSDDSVEQVSQAVQAVRRAGDIVVVSLHWGGNWGYAIPAAQVRFAHRLVDVGAADVIHGHSSHHAKGIEVYRDRPVLYGCGDLLTDYEGISGNEQYRGDLGLMYFVRIDTQSGRLLELELVPVQTRQFRLRHTADEDRRWLDELLNREGRQFGTRIEAGECSNLFVRW